VRGARLTASCTKIGSLIKVKANRKAHCLCARPLRCLGDAVESVWSVDQEEAVLFLFGTATAPLALALPVRHWQCRSAACGVTGSGKSGSWGAGGGFSEQGHGVRGARV
jgi:hypothetical protein